MSEQVQAQNPAAPTVVSLVSPNLPADQGLSSLGLLLQLGGSISAAFVCVAGFIWLWAATWMGGGAMLGILLISILGLVRSLMHRAAGTELLYGPQPLRGIKRYTVVALAHSALLALVLASPLYQLPVRTSVAIGLACATWPAILLLILRQPRFQRYQDELPISEDKGFEGAAVLMTILGIAGLCVGGVLLWTMIQIPGALRGLGALLVLTLGLLVIRSVVHVAAGVSGLGNASLDLSVERVGRYANLGIISALLTAGVMFLSVVGSRADFSSILSIAVIGWVLAIWPLILRRYFAERHFASLLAGNDDPIHRRAPDTGLTALGWLLISMGGAQLSLSVLAIVGGSADLRDLGHLLPALSGNVWTAALISLAHIGAGVTVVQMNRHHRAVVTAVGSITLVLQASNLWPTWKALTTNTLGEYPSLTATLGLSMVPLVTAAVMIALVQRKVTPMARATVRVPARQ